MENEAYISLGSNLGDRELNLLRAIAELGKLPATKVSALSRFYETTPVGDSSLPLFYNAALRLTTELAPEELLNHLARIERDIFSRNRHGRLEARRMDLDILLIGDLVMQTAELTLPHPRMCERRFVLEPLREIAPDVRHPLSRKTITELFAGLVSDETVTPI